MRVYVREWRLNKDLSQTELAKRIGVTKGEISRLEGGTRRITTDWLEKMANAMQIDPKALLKKPEGEDQALSVGGEPPRPGRPPIERTAPILSITRDDSADLRAELQRAHAEIARLRACMKRAAAELVG